MTTEENIITQRALMIAKQIIKTQLLASGQKRGNLDREEVYGLALVMYGANSESLYKLAEDIYYMEKDFIDAYLAKGKADEPI